MIQNSGQSPILPSCVLHDKYSEITPWDGGQWHYISGLDTDTYFVLLRDFIPQATVMEQKYNGGNSIVTSPYLTIVLSYNRHISSSCYRDIVISYDRVIIQSAYLIIVLLYHRHLAIVLSYHRYISSSCYHTIAISHHRAISYYRHISSSRYHNIAISHDPG